MSSVFQPKPGAVTPTDAGSRPKRLLWHLITDRPSTAVGAAILATFVALAVFAPWIAPYGLTQQVGPVYGPPSVKHWLGLDDGGIDMLTLLMWGARISLLVGFAATIVSVTLGGVIGTLSGYFGGVIDVVLMRITDYFLVVPAVPLMIVVAAIWGPSLSHIILVIGLLGWTSMARVIRAQVKSVRERVYIKRAQSLGAGHARILLTHVLPQIAPLIVANSVLSIANAIFYETALAFLGLGDPATLSWGKMIQNAFQRTAISYGAWWAIVPPGICVAAVILTCSLIGRTIEDAINPRLKVAHLGVGHFRLRSLKSMES